MDLVTNLQGPHRANLELPLPRHHLSIDARDDEACLHAQPAASCHHLRHWERTLERIEEGEAKGEVPGRGPRRGNIDVPEGGWIGGQEQYGIQKIPRPRKRWTASQ